MSCHACHAANSQKVQDDKLGNSEKVSAYSVDGTKSEYVHAKLQQFSHYNRKSLQEIFTCPSVPAMMFRGQRQFQCRVQIKLNSQVKARLARYRWPPLMVAFFIGDRVVAVESVLLRLLDNNNNNKIQINQASTNKKVNDSTFTFDFTTLTFFFWFKQNFFHSS